MKHSVWSAVLPCLAASAFAQSSPSSYSQTFCNAGLTADGYVDFNDLPPAPAYPQGGATAPFTATLPVHGIPGLSVQVQVPSIQRSPEQAAAYTVQSGTVSFASPISLGLAFSAPVKGVGVDTSLPGRFGFNFFLGTDPENSVGPLFQQTVNANTYAFGPYSLTLQAVDRVDSFSTAFLGGTPDPNETTVGATLSNLRVQSVTAEANIEAGLPKRGLSLWLRNQDIPRDGQGFRVISPWPDSSGAEHNAVPSQAGVSSISSDGRACRPAFVFGDPASYLKFNLPIDGWREMTVFLVASAAADPNAYASQNSALFWQENHFWGNTFVSPYQTHAAFRFGTEQVGNQPIVQRPVNVGADDTVTRAVHNNDTDSLYVNGRLALRQGGKAAVLNGTTGEALIGQGLNGTPFSGKVSEILVYNRVLSDEEAATVEQYLRDKFSTN